jgi:hypothetical protein
VFLHDINPINCFLLESINFGQLCKANDFNFDDGWHLVMVSMSLIVSRSIIMLLGRRQMKHGMWMFLLRSIVQPKSSSVRFSYYWICMTTSIYKHSLLWFFRHVPHVHFTSRYYMTKHNPTLITYLAKIFFSWLKQTKQLKIRLPIHLYLEKFLKFMGGVEPTNSSKISFR